MHVKAESAFSYVDLAKNCIDQSASFAAEIDLDLASAFDMKQIITMRNNVTLYDLFSPKKFEKIRQILVKAFELDIRNFAHFVPLFTLNSISEKLLSQGEPLPLDLTLWMYAKRKQKHCFGVENFEEHYEVLHNIPYEYQALQLYNLSKNVSDVRKEISRISTYYQNAEIGKIYRKAKKSLGSMRKIMLYDRNDIIADKIVQSKDSGRIFCAVGAAHLYGKNGILAQLKRKNYEVKPIYKAEEIRANR